MVRMADVVHAAAQLWDIYQDDNTILATLISDRKALALAIAGGTVTGDVVQGSKNNVNYTIRPGFTIQDRLTMLDLAIKGINANVRPSRNHRIRMS
jgi:hypothetical protein